MGRALAFARFVGGRLKGAVKPVCTVVGVVFWVSGFFLCLIGDGTLRPRNLGYAAAYVAATALGAWLARTWQLFVEHEKETAERVAKQLIGQRVSDEMRDMEKMIMAQQIATAKMKAAAMTARIATYGKLNGP